MKESNFPIGLMFVSSAALWAILFESVMGLIAYENGEAELEIPKKDFVKIKKQLKAVTINAIRASWNEQNYIPQMVANALFFMSEEEIREIGNQYFNKALDDYLKTIEAQRNG